MGNDVLMLRWPRDKVVIKEHSVAWNGPASVGTTRLDIVDDELGCRGAMKKVERALEASWHGYGYGYRIRKYAKHQYGDTDIIFLIKIKT
jgi:hypothetical protein